MKNMFMNMTEKALASQAIKDLKNSNEKYDLVIQFWLACEAFIGLSHHFNATVIGFSPVGSSTFMDYHTGNISPTSFVPNLMLPYTSEMTFYQRTINTLTTLLMNAVFSFFILPAQNEMLQKYFPGAPDLSELTQKVNLFLVNTHYSTEGVKPYLSNLIHIGGFHLQEKQELPAKLKQFLDEAEEGVVYMSLGSNMKSSSLDKDKIEAFSKTFSKLKMKVLWKFEKDFPGLPKNIRIEKWLPQRAVLDHPNVKVFITHGGYGGTTESIYNGKPMLAIPFFGDQKKNAAEIERQGYGLTLEMEEVTEETITNALKELLVNEKYSENVKKTSSLLRNQPINPMELAVFWVEHVLKHKNTEHLRTVASKLPFYQYFLLDVAAFLLLCVVLLCLIVRYSFKACICFIKFVYKRKNKEKML